MKKLLFVLFMFCFIRLNCCVAGDDIPVVSNVVELSGIVDVSWTNNSMAKVVPPGRASYNNDIGVAVYAEGFAGSFLDALIPVTNNIGTNSFLMYPLVVTEVTNDTGSGRIRLYASALDTNALAFYTTTVTIANYPVDWIEGMYGEPPQYLGGDELQAWYDDRDPQRQVLKCSLIASNDIPYYEAMLTNTSYSYAGTNSNTILSIYSNNIVFFDSMSAGGNVNFYLHAPPGVAMLDLFRSETNHLQSSGWQLAGTLGHNTDPLLLDANVTSSVPLFYCAGNALTDSDNDGLSDAREMRIYGTDAHNVDSDGDGVRDGMEILNYGMNALSADSDADGMTDWEEMLYFRTYVKAWGRSDSYQISIPSGLNDLLALSAGGAHNLALRKNRTVVAWGDNSYGQCNVPAGLSGVYAVSAGNNFSLALKGVDIVAWGNNSYGQCNVPSGYQFYKISAGENFAMGLDLGFKGVVCWGKNNYGQCNPPASLWGHAVEVSAGGAFGMAIRNDKTVVVWGINDYEQCNVPSNLTDVVQISAGNAHCLALRADGTIVAWGFNGSGECNVPSNLTDVVQISAGYAHSMALLSDGTVRVWGYNGYNQCNIPNNVTNITTIHSGYSHCVAITKKVVNPISADSDMDGLKDGWEVNYNLDPLDPHYDNGGYGDPDNDKLLNIGEQSAGTDPHNWDSDGELLPDGWEVANGLNPLVADTLTADTDNDGLCLLDEYRYATSPNDIDTDGDGVSDGDEIPHSPGSNPNDADDYGSASNCVTFKLTVGDSSGSHSERWRFDIYDGDKEVIRHVDNGFGTPGSKEYALVKGKKYTFKIDWVATDPGYAHYPTPDYDWEALINDSDAEGVRSGLYNTGMFIVKDPNNLLTTFRNNDDVNPIDGLEGEITVVNVDLDTDIDNDGDIDNNDDESEWDIGGVVTVNQDDDNGNGIPDTNDLGFVSGEDDLKKIEINLEPGAEFYSGTLKLEAISGGGKIKIWHSANKVSEYALPLTWNTGGGSSIHETLYVEGVKKSDSARDVELRLRYTLDSQHSDDSIKLTVINPQLVPDYNHDRKIDDDDENQATASNPFHL